MRRLAAGLVALVSIVAAACGNTPTDVQAGSPETDTAAPDSTAEPAVTPASAELDVEPTPTVIREPDPLTTTVIDVVDRLPPPEGGVAAPDRGYKGTTEEYCAGTGKHRIEMAFKAVVRTVDRSSVAPWVTFDVTAWYTREVQTVMALWASDFPGQPGEEWLIASSRYFTTMGDVYWCESVPATAANIAEWDERYGGSVPPDSRVPEHPPSPAVLRLIDEGEARWRDTGVADYTATVSFFDHDTYERGRCGAFGARITVEAGRVVQAYDIRQACLVDPSEVHPIADLFPIARELAGLAGEVEDGHILIDETYGFFHYFGGSDRSLEVALGVSDFVPVARPLDLRDPGLVLAEAREKWESSGVDDYTVTFDVRCFCGVETPYTVTVRDGRPVGSPIERSGNWPPLTVDELFTGIETQRGDGPPVLVFDDELGHPVEAHLDPEPGGEDDEVSYFILDLTVD